MTLRTRPARRRRLLSLLSVAIVGGLLPPAAAPAVLAADPGAGHGPDTQAVRVPFSAVASVPVAPGAAHDRGVWTTDRGSQWVHVVDVDLQDPAIRIVPGLSNGRVTGLETLGGQAARVSSDGNRVVAAINGDVWGGYSSSAAHAPNGLHVLDGEIITATRIKRPTFGILADGSPRIGDVGVDVTINLPDGITVLGADRINKARRFNDVVIYTRQFGSSTLTGSGGVEVVLDPGGAILRPNATFNAVATLVRSGGDTPILPGMIVLSADGLSEAALRSIPVGANVSFTTTIDAGWEQVQQAIGGREWVLRDGATYIYPRPSSADQIHPRTAVGVTASGDLVLVVVDGRQAGYSDGTTLPDLAELMRQRGAVQALNLDGGGSSTLLVREPGDVSASLANEPSDGRQRPVSNSLLVVATTPTGPLSTLLLRPSTPTIVVGNEVTFTVKGHDVAFNGIPLSGTVAWSADPAVGTIDAGGRFVATAPGVAQVTATALGLTATTTITVLPDTTAPAPQPPTGQLHADSILSSEGLPYTVSWPAATDDGSGVVGYRVRQSTDLGPWVELPLASPMDRELRLSLQPGRDYQFSVAAVDAAGNVSGWVNGAPFRVTSIPEDHRAIRYSSGWISATWAGYVDGSGRWARRSGAYARFTFTGSQVAWIAPYARTRGTARIYVDGRYAGSVSLYRTSTSYGRVAFTKAWPSSGRHTIEIRVAGTSGRPRVDVDGFVMLHPSPLGPTPG